MDSLEHMEGGIERPKRQWSDEEGRSIVETLVAVLSRHPIGCLQARPFFQNLQPTGFKQVFQILTS